MGFRWMVVEKSSLHDILLLNFYRNWHQTSAMHSCISWVVTLLRMLANTSALLLSGKAEIAQTCVNPVKSIYRNFYTILWFLERVNNKLGFDGFSI